MRLRPAMEAVSLGVEVLFVCLIQQMQRTLDVCCRVRPTAEVVVPAQTLQSDGLAYVNDMVWRVCVAYSVVSFALVSI